MVRSVLSVILFAAVCFLARDAQAATYYVRTGGSNTNNGTSPGQAWQTIQKAAATMVAGDTVYVGAGTYAEMVQPSNDGTAANPIKYIADTAGTFTGDAGSVILNGGANARALDVSTDDYQQWYNFKFTGGTQSALYWSSSLGGYLQGCEIYSSSSDGIVVRLGSVLTIYQTTIRDNVDYGVEIIDGATTTIHQCTILRNSKGGIGAYGSGANNTTIKRCTIASNPAHGVYLDQGTATLSNLLLRGNSQHGIYVTYGTVTIWHITSAYNTLSGICVADGAVSLRNSILANNTNYGMLQSAGTFNHSYNCISGNSSGSFSGTYQSTGETLASPRFWSATCLELQDGSPCLNTGVNPAGAVTDDLEGTARPVGGAYDMGCYETVPLNYSSLTNAYSSLNPYAWWRLNETSGTSASDQVAGRNGIYQNGTILGALGPPIGNYNRAADFDGVNDKVHLGTAINPTVTTMSFVGWLKADAFGVTNPDILSKTSGSADANYFWSLGLVSVGGLERVQFRFRAGGTTAVAAATSSNVGTSAWVFVAGVYDGQAIIVYKDGVEVGRTTLSGTPDLNSSANAAIGDNATGGRPFDGQIDEVAVFARALKPREIGAMYASAIKGSISGAVSVPKLWGVDEDDGELFALTNYSSGATLVSYGRLKWNNNGTITDIINDSNISSLAVNRNGRAYLTSDNALGSAAAPVLLSFDLASASTTQPNVLAIVGHIPTLTEIRGLRFDPLNGDLYALRSDGWLYVIDPATAAITRTVGQIAGLGEVVTTAEDLVFDAYGNLYVMDDTDDELYRVSKATGAILETINNGGSIGTVQGLSWDNLNNRIIASETDTDFFVSAPPNLSSASYTTGLSTVGLTDVEAIDFVLSEGRTGIWPVGVRIIRWKEIR